MIEFVGISKSFTSDFWKGKKEVLKDLSFKVEPGSLCGYLGANGAGKTTSIKGLLGFISFDRGELKFDKDMGKSKEELRSNIGYFPERPYFYPGMTGRSFATYLGRLQGLSKNDCSEQIKTWSERLGIDFALDQKIRSYSKGMLQRLGFVTCLIHRPKLVILDEPLSGLDPLGRKEFKDILTELHRNGSTVFFSSHIVSDVEEVSDSIVVIKEGTCFFSGAKKDILKQETAKSVRVSFNSSQDFDLGKHQLLQREGDFYRALVSFEEKDHFLQSLLEKNCTIEDVHIERKTLEEIIYNSRQG
jgi:ABC-2 type transport system ATP-binding protein